MPTADAPAGGTLPTGGTTRAGDAELLHLPLQGGPLHAQAGRGPVRAAQHPAGLAQDAEDVLPLGVGQRDRRGGRRRRPATAAGLQVAERDLQRRARREDDRALDDVLQLADVARPGVAHQGVHDRGRDGLDLPAHPPGEPLGEMADQQRDVVAALAQRRQHDREDVQAVVEVAAEAAVGRPSAPGRGSWPPPGARPPGSSACCPGARTPAPAARGAAWAAAPAECRRPRRGTASPGGPARSGRPSARWRR